MIIRGFELRQRRGVLVSFGGQAAVVAVAAAVVAVAAAARCRSSCTRPGVAMGGAQAGSPGAGAPGTGGGAWVDRHRIDPETVEVTTCRIDRSDPEFPQIRFEALVTNSTAITGTLLLDVKFLDRDGTIQRTDYPSDSSIRPGQKVKISSGALVGEDEFPDWNITCEIASAEVFMPAD